MRAKDFIFEKKYGLLDPAMKQASPGLHTLKSKDSNLPYQLYRASLLMAKSPGDLSDLDADSQFGNRPLISTYTQTEKNMVDAAAKSIGLEVVTHAFSPSTESSDINKTSPILPFKGY